MLRGSDLSNLSIGGAGAGVQNNNFRNTPDTQDNSHIFYQSTDGHDLQPGGLGIGNSTYRNQMNQQLNIDDDDELIEIRPDGDLNLFRDNSKTSEQSSFIQENTYNNQSLEENVKDTTTNNSPVHHQINELQNKKEIFI